MKKISFGFLFWLSALVAQAQHSAILSSNTIRYMVTHEPATGLYTAWVVPDYNTPNANNPESEDRGATAQFSLKVPKGFTLSNLRDIRGSWDKAAYKLTVPATNADANWAYYVIGKAPQETNYGEFRTGEPVALFTFKGEGADPAQVSVLPMEDRFVQFAESQMSLNVQSSFYTRSGQRAVASARPMEQMSGVIKLKEVLKQKEAQLGLLTMNTDELGTQPSLLIYPNPTTDVVEVTYFSTTDQVSMQVELSDAQGTPRQTIAQKAKAGFNSARFNLTQLPGGVYFVRASGLGRPMIRKVIRQ